MFLGCICEGYPPGPFHVWEKETEVEREVNGWIMEQDNMEIEDQENQMRQRARMPGTHENRVLRELNANIRRLDHDDPLPSGYWRMPRRPEWEFKLEREVRDRQRRH
ncbi:hypothetical protein K469DRAFT_714906 [Zopfia rhizophila CBS 207.26]|uniref:Uncharacterized protein n=1 Tax=Zopfia rhizophila CBS 207.26 TaxID=1314779 RepID=A0A6A6ESM2_9PEZI|nr:hypothetical protein K469DRAFT_714906 [Zopfia rhizophila CBS 207.26]